MRSSPYKLEQSDDACRLGYQFGATRQKSDYALGNSIRPELMPTQQKPPPPPPSPSQLWQHLLPMQLLIEPFYRLQSCLRPDLDQWQRLLRR